MAVDYADISSLYLRQRDQYASWCEFVGGRIRDKLRKAKLETFVEWRVKEVDSFVKKSIRKGYANPIDDVGDKAGIRVIIHYLEDAAKVERLVEDFCVVHRRESKLDALDFDKLGYLGVHLDVSLQEEQRIGGITLGTGMKGEIQIHTKAQSAWAVISHDVLYKAAVELPPEVKRRVTRLVAFVEAFDDEVSRFRKQIAEHPDFAELEVIGTLDQQLVQMTGRHPDKSLSAQIVPTLLRLYDAEPTDVVENRVLPYIEEKRSELVDLFDRYEGDSRVVPLLHQPEAFVLFERIENDPDNLRQAWEQAGFDVGLLEDMAAVWGHEV